MEKELTKEQRISVIRHAYANSHSITPRQSVADFVADVKSEAVFAEPGLLDNHTVDLEDEASRIEHDPSAESIDEEDEGMGLSDEMKGVYG